MMMRMFLTSCVNSKTSLFTEDIFTCLEKICLARVSDIFMNELVQILSMAKESEHIRMMGKYKIADILCDSYQKLFEIQENRKPILDTLEIMSREKEMGRIITSKISSNLIDGERDHIVYKIISNLVQDKENIDMLLQSGLLAAIRADITASKGTETKHGLGILKAILGHCKLSKEDNEALLVAL